MRTKCCTPGFTPLTVTTPPTLHGYVILYKALPNTAQLARWGSWGLLNIIKQGLHACPHAYLIFWSLTLKKVREPLGLKTHPRRGHDSSGARSRWRVQILSSPSDGRGSLRDDSHTASAMSQPGTVFILRNIYLRRSAVEARVWVRDERWCGAMLATCLLVEKLSAVQHRGGSSSSSSSSRVEQRAQLQVGSLN